ACGGSSCGLVLATDPFAGVQGHDHCTGADCLTRDTRISCCIEPGDTAGGVHIDTCSYPSQQPNSDPSDCVVTPNQCNSDTDCNDNNVCTLDQCVSEGPGGKFC